MIELEKSKLYLPIKNLMNCELSFEGEIFLENTCKQVIIEKSTNSIEYIVKVKENYKEFKILVYHTDEKRNIVGLPPNQDNEPTIQRKPLKLKLKHKEIYETFVPKIVSKELGESKEKLSKSQSETKFFKLYQNGIFLSSSFFSPKKILEIPVEPNKGFQKLEIKIYNDDEGDSQEIFTITFHLFSEVYFRLKNKITPQADVWINFMNQLNSLRDCLFLLIPHGLSKAFGTKFQIEYFISHKITYYFRNYHIVTLDKNSFQLKTGHKMFDIKFNFETQYYDHLEKLFQFIQLFHDFKFINLTNPQISLKLDVIQNCNSLWGVCQKEIIIQRRNYSESNIRILKGTDFKIHFELELQNELFYFVKVLFGDRVFFHQYSYGKNEIEVESKKGMNLNHPMELKFYYKPNSSEEYQFYTHQINFIGSEIKEFSPFDESYQKPNVVKSEKMKGVEEIQMVEIPIQSIVRDSPIMTPQLCFEGEIISKTPYNQVIIKKTNNSIEYVVNIKEDFGEFTFLVHSIDTKIDQSTKKQEDEEGKISSTDSESLNEAATKFKFYKLEKSEKLLKSSLFSPTTTLEIPIHILEPKKQIDQFFEKFEIKIFNDCISKEVFRLTFNVFIGVYFKKKDSIKSASQESSWKILMKQFNSLLCEIPMIESKTKNRVDIFFEIQKVSILNKQEQGIYVFKGYKSVVLGNTSIEFISNKDKFKYEFEIQYYKHLEKLFQFIQLFHDFEFVNLTNSQISLKFGKSEIMEDFKEIPNNSQPIVRDSLKESGKNFQYPPIVVKTEVMKDFETSNNPLSKDIPRVRDSIKESSGNSQLPPKVVKTEIMKEFEEVQNSNKSQYQPNFLDSLKETFQFDENLQSLPKIEEMKDLEEIQTLDKYFLPITRDSIQKSSNVLSWSVDEVCKWVRRIGSVYVDMKLESIFRENLIDGEALMSISNGDLKEMGFELWGHRFKIMNEINKLK
jgi:hypothetical protein